MYIGLDIVSKHNLKTMRNHWIAFRCSTYYGEIFSKDPVRRQQAKSKWIGTMQRLYDILQEYSPQVLGKEAAGKLLKSGNFIHLL